MYVLSCVFAFLFLMAGSTLAQGASEKTTPTLDPLQLGFVYQSNLEPWERFTCKHEKASVGLHEWDVYCKVGERVHRYGVHLVLSYYSRTVYGGSAYEMLYWVTDWTGTRPASDSTTIWFHQKELDSRAVVIEAAQGIENDLSSLRLLIKIK